MIESDLMFPKTMLSELISRPLPYLVYGELLDKEVYRLNIPVSTILDTDFVKKALEAWNSVGNCSINFTSPILLNENYKRFPVMLLIEEDYTGKYPDLLQVTPPFSAMGTAEIRINSKHSLWSGMSDTQKQYLVMHALGHLVGLRHNDSKGNHTFVLDDPNSIMQSEEGLKTNKNLWQGLTVWDKEALRELYPLTNPVWTSDCQPRPEDNKRTLEIGKKYTITTECEHPWIFRPTYSYEFIAEDGVVTHKTKGNTVELTFNKSGNCTIITTANDAYGEKDADGNHYTYRTTYNVGASEPVFTYPKSIKLGEFCDFKLEMDEAAYPDATYNFYVSEYLFDDQSDKNVTINRVSNNHIRYRFNDYGQYLVSVSCTYGGKRLAYNYVYQHLFRPEITVEPHYGEFIDPNESLVPLKPDTTIIYGAPLQNGDSFGRSVQTTSRKSILHRIRNIQPNHA